MNTETNNEFLSMNGEAGVVLRRILAEDKMKITIEYVSDDDLTYSDTDDDNEYMNEPMDCDVCKRTDIPRKDLHWNTGGGSYTDTCEECFQEEEDEDDEDEDDEDEDDEDDEDEDEDEEGWHCCKCKKDFKESEVNHIDEVDAPVCFSCCIKYGF